MTLPSIAHRPSKKQETKARLVRLTQLTARCSLGARAELNVPSLDRCPAILRPIDAPWPAKRDPLLLKRRSPQLNQHRTLTRPQDAFIKPAPSCPHQRSVTAVRTATASPSASASRCPPPLIRAQRPAKVRTMVCCLPCSPGVLDEQFAPNPTPGPRRTVGSLRVKSQLTRCTYNDNIGAAPSTAHDGPIGAHTAAREKVNRERTVVR